MKTIGIVGFGSFGKFMAEKLSSHAHVRVYSRSGRQNSWMATLDEVAAADYVVLAIPLEAYEQTLTQLRPLLRPTSVLVDICSVKVQPTMIIKRLLPDQPFVATHPMFGPESASILLAGHTFVMCPEVSDSGPYDAVKQFANSLGLGIIEMSAAEHDQEIAVVQGLTFFIARVLDTIGVHDQKLITPSFERLLNLAELDRSHSAELFATIQNGNPYTREIRQRFIESTRLIDNDLAVSGHNEDELPETKLPYGDEIG